MIKDGFMDPDPRSTPEALAVLEKFGEFVPAAAWFSGLIDLGITYDEIATMTDMPDTTSTLAWHEGLLKPSRLNERLLDDARWQAKVLVRRQGTIDQCADFFREDRDELDGTSIITAMASNSRGVGRLVMEHAGELYELQTEAIGCSAVDRVNARRQEQEQLAQARREA